MRLGYTDPLCFSRIFKKIVGTSPEVYRQKMNKRLKNNTVTNYEL